MNPFEMVVMIILIVTIGKVLTGRKNRISEIKDQLVGEDRGGAENTRLQSEVARLNDRIRVLERLATDPAKRLSDEIESLKDK
ncbi:hypothetical protein [Sandarakinorhabdus sp.]|uniref:hypothetical protein n=1 Tax=Sandarakinorhabdus sp. TaxID=1916663 RepID=UPI00286E2406|nr:hypothetical protein [Sandarakinorhabdus sp.]